MIGGATIWSGPCDSGCEGVAGADSFFLGSAQEEVFMRHWKEKQKRCGNHHSVAFFAVIFRVFHFSFKFIHFSIHSYIFFIYYCLSDC